jgi:hypothetical protein
VNLADAELEMTRLNSLIDKGITEMVHQAQEYAVAEDEYRCARATVYLASEGTVGERTSRVDLATSQERQRAHLAEGVKQAAVEAVRSRRAQLSAYQTLLNSHQAEANLVRTSSREFSG